jgi:MFS family permease
VQGWLSAVWALAAIIGPILGAFIVEHLHWAFVFWINLPVGAVTIGLLCVFLNEMYPALVPPFRAISAPIATGFDDCGIRARRRPRRCDADLCGNHPTGKQYSGVRSRFGRFLTPVSASLQFVAEAGSPFGAAQAGSSAASSSVTRSRLGGGGLTAGPAPARLRRRRPLKQSPQGLPAARSGERLRRPAR